MTAWRGALGAGVLLLMALANPASASTQLKAIAEADGGVVRALDMLTGELTDIEIKNGQTKTFRRLLITLRECRYPVDNPASDAFAYLIIRDVREDKPRFEGWMTAASPALSALDHPRYDVWVLRCNIPAGNPASGG